MFRTFEKSYQTLSGNVTVIIFYFTEGDTPELDFDILGEIEMAYGYEDEDQLTFYPNTCKLYFDNAEQFNYDTLYKSVSQFENTLPAEHLKYSGVEILIDGVRKFKGYIDEETLDYDDENMQVSFEVLDLTMALRDMNVDRDKIIYIDTFGNENRVPNDSLMILPLPFYGIFKQVWDDFPQNFEALESIEVPGLYGVFSKHNWIFTGRKVSTGETRIKDWSNLSEFLQTYFIYDSMGLFGESRPCRTWTDFLRLIAITFGAIIGVADYGKVYFRKRFTNEPSAVTDVTNKVQKYPKIGIHLKALRGVVVKNHWQGDRTYEAGTVERTPNGDFKFEDRVASIDTYTGSYNDLTSGATCVYTDNFEFPVFAGVVDPELPGTGIHGYQQVGEWLFKSRKLPKQKIDCTLEGINYNMVSIYKYAPAHNEYINIEFRPMTMKKKLVAHLTDMLGLETKLAA